MKTFKQFIIEAGATSNTLRKLAANKQKKDVFGNRNTNVPLDILQNLEKNASERHHNRYPEQSSFEPQQTIRSRPTPQPDRFPLTPSFTFIRNPKKPLTQQIRDQRAAAAGFSGQGSLPKGSKLYRQSASGISVGDDPISIIMSASKQGRTPKPLHTGRQNLSRGFAAAGNLLDIRPVDSPDDPMSSIDIQGNAKRRAQHQFNSRRGLEGV